MDENIELRIINFSGIRYAIDDTNTVKYSASWNTNFQKKYPIHKVIGSISKEELNQLGRTKGIHEYIVRHVKEYNGPKEIIVGNYLVESTGKKTDTEITITTLGPITSIEKIVLSELPIAPKYIIEEKCPYKRHTKKAKLAAARAASL